ncbi:MAG: HEAT repeat domain-containing protein [Devosia sp.]|nr:HEAT repeat domain-containing protein [Devosia sp.]
MNTLDTAFADPNPSVRLNAALSAGITPSPGHLDALLARCAVEPDFQVREILTWALLRLPADIVLPRLLAELDRPGAQARSQALHTLSKLRDRSAWPTVAARLDDQDPDVVRTAWYTAVALVPENERNWLAEKLATRLGQGGPDVRMSLSRALAGLGRETIAPVLVAAAEHKDAAVRQHAAAVDRLLDNPDLGFTLSLGSARREVGLGRTRSAKG